jgi:hypothetical protein
MLKKIVAEFKAEIPPDIRVDEFVHLIADYIRINRFTMDVERVTAYPPDSKIFVHDIKVDLKQM